MARMEDKRNAHSILVETSEDKKSLGIPRCTCEYNIKTYLLVKQLDVANIQCAFGCSIAEVINIREYTEWKTSQLM